jgi:hypothetical protein
MYSMGAWQGIGESKVVMMWLRMSCNFVSKVKGKVMREEKG